MTDDAALMQRIEGYQASRDYAIDLLAKALGVEPDKLRAVEYYARLASERIAELDRRVADVSAGNHTVLLANQEVQDRATKAEAERDAQTKLLMRWLRITNLAKREPGATVADWDALRQETHNAIARREPTP